MTKRGFLYSAGLGVAALLSTGCGTKPPPVYDVHGKVTLKGKSYERLIIHFKPKSDAVTMYNLGVAETDKDGNFKTVMSGGGNGLQEGEYKVLFTLQTVKGRAVAADEKADDAGANVKVVEMVGKPYDVGSEAEATVFFTVKPGDNEFNFDIPTTAK